MRRHCRNGAFKNFDYLLKKKILDKNDQNLKRILISRDKDGRTLLHSAAEGGCKDIFNAILIYCVKPKSYRPNALWSHGFASRLQER